MSVITSTMQILNEICVGENYFLVAIMLRDSLLMNSILLNVEVWFSLTVEETKKFATIDKIFLRKVLQVPSTTPVTALYLECGIVPVNFLIKARRIMYLHYLLSL